MRIEGYFTVEAALVMPTVLAEVVLVICMLFFQYDRCLMEQDLGVLVLRGIMMDGEDNQSKMEELEKAAYSLDRQKYLMWKREDVEMKLGRGMLCVGQSGELSAMNLSWSASRDFEGHIISPVLLIRSCRKITGGK